MHTHKKHKNSTLKKYIKDLQKKLARRTKRAVYTDQTYFLHLIDLFVSSDGLQIPQQKFKRRNLKQIFIPYRVWASISNFGLSADSVNENALFALIIFLHLLESLFFCWSTDISFKKWRKKFETNFHSTSRVGYSISNVGPSADIIIIYYKDLM